MDTENRLIELLPPGDRRRLLSVAEPSALSTGQVLCRPGLAIRQVHFPIDACIALMTVIDRHDRVQVGMVGGEGMLGAPLILGVGVAPWQAVVQGAGSAWRVGVVPFRRELAASAALRLGVERYLFVLLGQLATSAACMRFHEVVPRLARWMLMAQDRAHADCFPATHERLAVLLGVRRASVTLAAGGLQRRGIIEYRRGRVDVLDRTGLEAAACSCYAADRERYRERLG